MGFDPQEPEQIRRLRAALKAAHISAGELWLNYFSIGGNVGEYEVEAYLQGLMSLPLIERDMLAMAANELIDAAPRIHAPYADDLAAAAGPEPQDDNGQERSDDGQERSEDGEMAHVHSRDEEPPGQQGGSPARVQQQGRLRCGSGADAPHGFPRGCSSWERIVLRGRGSRPVAEP